MNLTPEPVLPPLDPQPVPRSPAAAFFLSLLLPGAGQFYCQKISRGFWTLLPFAPVSLLTLLWTVSLVTVSTEPRLLFVWGAGVRFCLLLYVFAFLDAYFTSREMTAGTDSHVPENPRVAAILNLLTRGFGYWYLGERKKGLAVFVALGIVPYAIQVSVDPKLQVPLSIFLELLVVIFAVDAYRIARKRAKEILARIRPTPSLPDSSVGLPAGVPVALAGLFCVAYLGLAVIGILFPDYRSIDQAAARVTRGPQENSYSNPKYGVSLRAPASWSVTTPGPPNLVQASTLGGLCNASLVAEPRLPFLTLHRYAMNMTQQLKARGTPDYQPVEEKPATLAGLPARELVFAVTSGETHATQRYIITARGLSLYTLITTANEASSDACEPDLRFIREHLSLPR